MKARHGLLIAGVLISAWLALFADKNPVQGMAEPVARTATPSSARAPTPAARLAVPAPEILPLRQRAEVNTDLPPRQLFSVRNVNPSPVAVAATPAASAAPAPTAPALPFTYIGKKSQDGVWEVYLARQETTLVARERDVLEGRYRVDSIGATSMALTYLPLNQVQRLSLGSNY